MDALTALVLYLDKNISFHRFAGDTCYISKCVEDVTISKTITTRSNQKPWMTANVRALLKQRDSAFRTGDKAALKTARAKLSRAIREAKRAHVKKIHDHFLDSGDTRRMWQGIQAITNYRTTSPACDLDASLPDALNDFYARFEVQNNVVARKTIPPPTDQCFERLVMRHIKTQLPPSLDPMQFAYRPNRSTDDAISTTLHLALTHLDNKDSYVRMLFIDFSSAFNTIIPQHLIEKLNLLGLNTSLCNWILDFLTGRPQAVRIGNSISSTTTLSTGAPQGCVLSPLLFTLLTHDCAPTHSSNHIIKFADDTTVVGLISRNDESAYREEVQRLTAWCGANNLSLNVDKTKEMVVDFRRAQSDQSPRIIDGSSVKIVKSTKFLSVHLADNLTWSLNTSSITKKAQQRLYFLRRLRKAHLPPPILSIDNFICEKCKLVCSLMEKILALEDRIRSLERSSECESSPGSAGKGLDALGKVNIPPTPTLEPSQRGEWVTTQRHTRKAKANAKACPQEHHSSPLHVSNRFALLSDAPAEKPERALVLGDSILRHEYSLLLIIITVPRNIVYLLQMDIWCNPDEDGFPLESGSS
ncbi:hypothetical protein C0J50_5712 [Silurus asotus]|uniref:Reverse transcriptase domain-containing protein n=1 Tax=Silurus asotus TaxID=30991 RepID=A0AAD5FBQ0_SILAS|nr:hypothetical protein C0J50_5712 [Silurus asotus]